MGCSSSSSSAKAIATDCQVRRTNQNSPIICPVKVRVVEKSKQVSRLSLSSDGKSAIIYRNKAQNEKMGSTKQEATNHLKKIVVVKDEAEGANNAKNSSKRSQLLQKLSYKVSVIKVAEPTDKLPPEPDSALKSELISMDGDDDDLLDHTIELWSMKGSMNQPFSLEFNVGKLSSLKECSALEFKDGSKSPRFGNFVGFGNIFKERGSLECISGNNYLSVDKAKKKQKFGTLVALDLPEPDSGDQLGNHLRVLSQVKVDSQTSDSLMSFGG